MRLLLGFAVLAGCGRIGIEPHGMADGALTADAAPDAPPPCAFDGEPCDDRNICTVTSTCRARTCVSTEPTTCTAARSEDEFSQVQGDGGWFYGFWLVEGDASGAYEPTEFQEMAWLGAAWRPSDWEPEPSPSFTWTYLMAWGGHPGTYPTVRAPIRRWVSDVQGDAAIDIHLSKSDGGGGDGVRGILVVDGTVMLDRTIAGTDAAGFDVRVIAPLAIGTNVDWLIHPVGGDSSDTSNQTMTIAAP